MKYVSNKQNDAPSPKQRGRAADNTAAPRPRKDIEPPDERRAKAVERGKKKSKRKRKSPPQTNDLQVNDRRVQRMAGAGDKRRKRRRKNYALYYMLLFFIVAITGVTLSFTVFFKIDTIDVEGAVGITDEQIIETAAIKMGTNLLQMPTGSMEKAILDAYVTIESVKVKRHFPNRLDVLVKMADPEGVFLYNQQCYTVSTERRILHIGDAPITDNLPRIVGVDLKDIKAGDTLTDKKKYCLDEIDAIFEAIEENKLENVSYIDLNNPLEINLHIGDSYLIQVGGRLELNYKLHCAKTLLDAKISEDEKGIINVSVDNGMYSFRPAESIDPPLPEIVTEP